MAKNELFKIGICIIVTSVVLIGCGNSKELPTVTNTPATSEALQKEPTSKTKESQISSAAVSKSTETSKEAITADTTSYKTINHISKNVVSQNDTIVDENTYEEACKNLMFISSAAGTKFDYSGLVSVKNISELFTFTDKANVDFSKYQASYGDKHMVSANILDKDKAEPLYENYLNAGKDSKKGDDTGFSIEMHLQGGYQESLAFLWEDENFGSSRMISMLDRNKKFGRFMFTTKEITFKDKTPEEIITECVPECMKLIKYEASINQYVYSCTKDKAGSDTLAFTINNNTRMVTRIIKK